MLYVFKASLKNKLWCKGTCGTMASDLTHDRPHMLSSQSFHRQTPRIKDSIVCSVCCCCCLDSLFVQMLTMICVSDDWPFRSNNCPVSNKGTLRFTLYTTTKPAALCWRGWFSIQTSWHSKNLLCTYFHNCQIFNKANFPKPDFGTYDSHDCLYSSLPLLWQCTILFK